MKTRELLITFGASAALGYAIAYFNPPSGPTIPADLIDASRSFIARASSAPMFRHDSPTPDQILHLSIDQDTVPSALHAELTTGTKFQVVLVPIKTRD